MIIARPVVGSTIDARCTKCRKTVPHTVVSLKGATLDRVCCSACEHEHVYKAPAQKKVAATASKTDRTEWQKLQSDFDETQAVGYSMTAKYPMDTLIDHPTLGMGVVRRLAGQHTVEVLFESGTKLMRCNGGLR